MTSDEVGSAPSNPYVGPIPFREGQNLYGREHETGELADLLVSKRIVLLFAPSGAGKSSLIQAALIPRLRDQYQFQPLPTVRLNHRNEAVVGQSGVNCYALSVMRSLERYYPDDQQLPDEQLAKFTTLADFIESRLGLGQKAEKRQYWLLTLDQFEELFTLDPFDWDAKKAFLTDLGNLLAGAKLDMPEDDQQGPPPIWALFSMREDRVAQLQPFLDLFPTALAFRYRLNLLEHDDALEAVMKPAGRYMTKEAAKHLVKDLCTIQLHTTDGKDVPQQGRFVEPILLQVVCLRLWDKVVANDNRPIELGDVITAYGTSEVDQALSDYFNTEVEKAANATQVPQRNLRAWIEDNLITATGIRAQALREPALLEKKLYDAIGKLIDDAHLIRSDMRDDREWIELAHDRLVDTVLKGNKAWRDRNLKPFQLQAEIYAKTGMTHMDMLFLGEELNEAIRFATEHPEELNDDECIFIEHSRKESDKLKRQRHHKNIFIFAIFSGAVLIGAIIAIWLQLVELTSSYNSTQDQLNLTNEKLKSQEKEYKDRGEIYRKLAGIRKKSSVKVKDTLGELLDLHGKQTSILDSTEQLSNSFYNTLREILRNTPRAVDQELGQHSFNVRSLVFMADGHHLISGSWDRKIAIWRSDRIHTPVFQTEDIGAETYALALYEPTGVLVSTHSGGKIVLWRLTESGFQKLKELNHKDTGYRKQVTTVDFNREGTLLATAGWDKTILLWNISSPNEPARVASFGPQYHKAPISRIAFLPPDGKGERLVSTDLDGKIRIWRIPKSSVAQRADPRSERDFAVRDILNQNEAILSAAVSPNGQFLVAGDSKGYVYIWDLAKDDPHRSGLRLEQAHHRRYDSNSPIFDIAFSPDGHEFASIGLDEFVLRWTLSDALSTDHDLKEKEIDVVRVGGLDEPLYSVIYHPYRSGVVAVGGTRTVWIVDMRKSGSLLATPLMPDDQSKGPWRAVSIDSKSSTIAAAGRNDRILFWRRNKDGIRQIPVWTIDAGQKTMFVLHPDGSSLMTVACGGKLTIWKLGDDQKPVSTILAPGKAPQAKSCPKVAPSFSQQGMLFATALGSQLELWSQNTGGVWERKDVIDDIKDVIDDINVVAGNSPKGGPEHITEINSLAINAKSDFLAVGDQLGQIYLFEIKSGKLERASAPVNTGNGVVQSLAFRPDGNGLVSAGLNGVISEWSLPSLELKAFDTSHERSVTSLAFAARGKGTSTGRPILVSADKDGNVWEWTSGAIDGARETIAQANGHPVNAMALGADGLFLVTAGDALLAWNFDREEMMQAARLFIQGHGSTLSEIKDED